MPRNNRISPITSFSKRRKTVWPTRPLNDPEIGEDGVRIPDWDSVRFFLYLFLWLGIAGLIAYILVLVGIPTVVASSTPVVATIVYVVIAWRRRHAPDHKPLE